MWVCFIVRGVFYASQMPLWEGFDEPFHFAHLTNVAEGRDTALITREVQQSLSVAPLPWILRDLDVPHVTHDEFCKLSPEFQSVRRKALAAIEPAKADDPPGTLHSYERQQAPLYYWLFTPFDRMLSSATLTTRVLLLRTTGVLLASLLIPIGWLAARACLASEWLATTAIALAASMPGLLISIYRVSNETLAVVLATALLWLVSKRSSAVAIAVVLASALLTKAYFLSAVPIVLAVLLVRREPKKAGAVLAVVLLASGWWYVLNYLHTGTVTGEQNDAAARGVLGYITQVNWRQALDSTFLSHIWFGNWSFLQVRSWMYRVFAVVYATAAVLLIARRPRGAGIPALFFGAFVGGMAYHVLVTYASLRVSATTGWYLYAWVAAECILLTAASRWLGAAAAFLFAALDLFGMTFYLLPYYNCLTAHVPGGAVPAAKLAQVASLRLGVSYWLYVFATTACAALAIYCARQSARAHARTPHAASRG